MKNEGNKSMVNNDVTKQHSGVITYKFILLFFSAQTAHPHVYQLPLSRTTNGESILQLPPI